MRRRIATLKMEYKNREKKIKEKKRKDIINCIAIQSASSVKQQWDARGKKPSTAEYKTHIGGQRRPAIGICCP